MLARKECMVEEVGGLGFVGKEEMVDGSGRVGERERERENQFE